MTISIVIRRPDDWHLHVRDGEMLKAVLPFTARYFGRAILMPNLVPPIRTEQEGAAYRERVKAALPKGSHFTPLMTCYLTDETDPDDVERGFRDGVFIGAKLYPANATTNSAAGAALSSAGGDLLSNPSAWCSCAPAWAGSSATARRDFASFEPLGSVTSGRWA